MNRRTRRRIEKSGYAVGSTTDFLKLSRTESALLEDLLTMGNPRFWEMIEARRRSPRGIPLSEVRRRLGLTKPKSRRKFGRRQGR
jgi:hypothetical protein